MAHIECPWCHAEIPEKADRCGDCGRSVRDVLKLGPEVGSDYTAERLTPKVRPGARLIWIGLGLIVAGGLLIAVAFVLDPEGEFGTLLSRLGGAQAPGGEDLSRFSLAIPSGPISTLGMATAAFGSVLIVMAPFSRFFSRRR